jgi:muramoyltetrapeptide carboxypeptidase
MNSKRRQFTQRVTAAALAMGANVAGAMINAPIDTKQKSPTPKTTKAQRMHTRIKPRALKAGDTVALITPGGYVDDAQIEKSVRNIESIGLKAKLLPNARAARGNFAGTVQQRIDDLHAAFRDPNIAALWAIRGGSGCAHILPSLDYELIRRHPKIVIGYSDITALLLAIHRYSGLIAFHGPVASSTFSDYSVNHLRAVLFEGGSPYTMRSAHDNDTKAAESPEYLSRVLRAGMAEGILNGGNLSVLAALIGTPFAPAMSDALLFLEEVGEAPYRVDRLLTQIKQSYGTRTPTGAEKVTAGAAKPPAAIMFGVLRKCDPPKDEASLTLVETLSDFTDSHTVPAVSGYSFGHISHQMTLPIGVRARLDTATQTLTLLESAVQIE